MTLKRARLTISPTAKIRTWSTPDGRYALAEINSLLGLGRRYLVVRKLPNGNELIESSHRKRNAAMLKLDRLSQCQPIAGRVTSPKCQQGKFSW
jgi:hypothetical protein